MSWLAQLKPGKLARRLATYVILFSSVIAMGITAVELAVDYVRDLDQIDGRMQAIETSYIESLEGTLWVADKERLQTLLNGIVRQPDFVMAEILVDGKIYLKQGEHFTGLGVARTFDLTYQHLGKRQHIGELTVAASYRGAYQRIFNRLLFAVLANGLKTFLVALFIFLIFYRLIGRHIDRIAQYAHAHSNAEVAQQLILERKEPPAEDELSALVRSINHLRDELIILSKDQRQRAETLEDQTARLGREIVMRKNTEEKIQRLNFELEERVQRRTAQMMRARDEAEAANRAKSEFLASMSHELRTPLNAVLGFSQLMATDPELSSENRDNAQEIEEAGRLLLALVNQLLDLSRIESGQMDLAIEPFVIGSLTDQAFRLLAAAAQAASVELIDEGGDGRDAIIEADRARVQQALLNFLSNAIKYNRPRGKVKLSYALNTAQGRRAVRIVVSDTGRGIPDDKHKRVFGAFDRLGLESGNIEGAGIGLRITRHLVEAMGGTVGFTSVDGQGSTFWAEFPTSPQHAAIAA